MKPVKIFFIQDTLMSAGAERSHLEIMSRFSPNSNASMVYFYPKHDLREAYEQAGIKLHFLGLTGKYDWLVGIYRLVKLIRKERPQILVACLMRSTLMARAASLITGIPVVGTLVNDSYGDARLEELRGKGHWKFRFFWWLDRVGAGIHYHWISNARCLAESHIKALGLKREKISVVHRGRKVNIDTWQRRPEWSAATTKFIGYGRLLERKGFGELIRAFALLRNDYPNIELVIYGEGEERKVLEQLINSLKLGNSVRLPGASLEVEKDLLEADCYVFPSWYEGFSGALVEAMMAGIPIIASDIPMNLEAIVSGEHALTFNVRNVHDLKAKMEYALHHPEEMEVLGRKAREEGIKRFEINKIALQYETVLHRILNVPVPVSNVEPSLRQPLKVGVLLDSYEVPAWAWEMVRIVAHEGYGKIELFIRNGKPITTSSAPLLYRAYRWLDRKLFRVSPDAFVRKDLRSLPCWPVEEIVVEPVQTRHVDRFSEADIERLKTYNLDVIIRLGFRILKGEVLHVPKYGCWSFHHGDNRVNRGGPPAFWEVMNSMEETGSLLQVLNEKLDDGRVLYRSWTRTNPLSVNRNASRIFWKSLYFVPRIVKRLAMEGDEFWHTTLRLEQDEPGKYAPQLYRPPSNTAMFRLLLWFAWRNALRKWHEIINRESWHVYAGYGRQGLLPVNKTLKPVASPPGTYYADPFIWERNGITALFVERYTYASRKATIVALTWDGSAWSDAREVLHEPIHLSYPFLFEDDSVLYMVPESAEASEVVIYRCLEFPYTWRRDKVIMENMNGYDPTILQKDGRYWLFMNQQVHPGISPFDELFLYYSDSLSGPWISHSENPIVSDVKRSRPAGRIFQHEGHWYRPAQDSALHYGHRIRLQKITVWTEHHYTEETAHLIESTWDQTLQGTHTINYWKDWVVVDGFRR